MRNSFEIRSHLFTNLKVLLIMQVELLMLAIIKIVTEYHELAKKFNLAVEVYHTDPTMIKKLQKLH